MTFVRNNLCNVNLITTREAAVLVSYTTDYVARLAREGKIVAERRGNQWMVDRDSLKLFALEAEAEKRNRKENLRTERLKEKVETIRKENDEVVLNTISNSSFSALGQTGIISLCLFLLANLMWFALESNLNTSQLAEGVNNISDKFSESVIEPNIDFVSQVASLVFIKNNQFVDTSEDFFVKAEEQAEIENLSEDSVFVEQETPSFSNSNSELHNSFSDEVKVDFTDDGSGVVVPVFKSGNGDVYKFEITPAKSVED